MGVCVLSAFCDIFSWQDEVAATKAELEKMGKEIHECRFEMARARVAKMTSDEEHARAMDDLRQAKEAEVTVAEEHANTVKMMGEEVETLRQVGAFMSFGRGFFDIILCQSSGAEAVRVKDEEHAKAIRLVEVCVFFHTM